MGSRCCFTLLEHLPQSTLNLSCFRWDEWNGCGALQYYQAGLFTKLFYLRACRHVSKGQLSVVRFLVLRFRLEKSFSLRTICQIYPVSLLQYTSISSSEIWLMWTVISGILGKIDAPLKIYETSVPDKGHAHTFALIITSLRGDHQDIAWCRRPIDGDFADRGQRKLLLHQQGLDNEVQADILRTYIELR